MPFRITKESEKWFSEIREKDDNGFSLGFDILYFCFMAGISKGKKDKDIVQDQTSELVDYFPGRYRDKGYLLVALFLSTELRQLGINISEKETVYSEISKLVNVNAPSKLSDEGMHEFNKYVYGGFDVLMDWFDDKPQSLETFLMQFKIELDKNLNF